MGPGCAFLLALSMFVALHPARRICRAKGTYRSGGEALLKILVAAGAIIRGRYAWQ
jgi:hypothetical protein